MAADSNLPGSRFIPGTAIMMDGMKVMVRNSKFVLASTILLLALISPCTLLAQRGGIRGSRGTASPSAGTTPSPGPVNPAGPDLTGFNRAVALQATGYQVQQFHSFVESTEAAAKFIRDLLKVSRTATRTSDYSSQAHDLDFAIEELQTQNDRFLAGLSKDQRSGLKDLTKKLRKSSSEISKHFEAIDSGLSTPLVDNKQLTAILETLNVALTRFKEEQLKLGEEMSIPSPAK